MAARGLAVRPPAALRRRTHVEVRLVAVVVVVAATRDVVVALPVAHEVHDLCRRSGGWTTQRGFASATPMACAGVGALDDHKARHLRPAVGCVRFRWECDVAVPPAWNPPW